MQNLKTTHDQKQFHKILSESLPVFIIHNLFEKTDRSYKIILKDKDSEDYIENKIFKPAQTLLKSLQPQKLLPIAEQYIVLSYVKHLVKKHILKENSYDLKVNLNLNNCLTDDDKMHIKKLYFNCSEITKKFKATLNAACWKKELDDNIKSILKPILEKNILLISPIKSDDLDSVMKNFKVIASLNKAIFDECYERLSESEKTKFSFSKIISFFRRKIYDTGIEYIEYQRKDIGLYSASSGFHSVSSSLYYSASLSTGSSMKLDGLGFL